MNRFERRIRWLREDLARAIAEAQKCSASGKDMASAEALGRALESLRIAVAALDEVLLDAAKSAA